MANLIEIDEAFLAELSIVFEVRFGIVQVEFGQSHERQSERKETYRAGGPVIGQGL